MAVSRARHGIECGSSNVQRFAEGQCGNGQHQLVEMIAEASQGASRASAETNPGEPKRGRMVKRVVTCSMGTGAAEMMLEAGLI